MSDPNIRLSDMPLWEALLTSGRVRRYHTEPLIIGEQTVAEHTWRAMALMYALWPRCTRSALIALLVHDGAEAEVGDVPSPSKWHYKDLAKCLEAAEDAVLEKMGLVFDLSPEEALWVRSCDWLEGMHFAINQMRMGNRNAGTIFDAYVMGFNSLPVIPEAVRHHIGELWVQLTVDYPDRLFNTLRPFPIYHTPTHGA